VFPCYSSNLSFHLSQPAIEAALRLPYELGADAQVIWTDAEETERTAELTVGCARFCFVRIETTTGGNDMPIGSHGMEDHSDVLLQDTPPDENEPIGTSFTLVQLV
jgi:hypothetical protein